MKAIRDDSLDDDERRASAQRRRERKRLINRASARRNRLRCKQAAEALARQCHEIEEANSRLKEDNAKLQSRITLELQKRSILLARMVESEQQTVALQATECRADALRQLLADVLLHRLRKGEERACQSAVQDKLKLLATIQQEKLMLELAQQLTLREREQAEKIHASSRLLLTRMPPQGVAYNEP